MVDMDMEMKIEMHYLYVPSNGNFLNQALPHLEGSFLPSANQNETSQKKYLNKNANPFTPKDNKPQSIEKGKTLFDSSEIKKSPSKEHVKEKKVNTLPSPASAISFSPKGDWGKPLNSKAEKNKVVSQSLLGSSSSQSKKNPTKKQKHLENYIFESGNFINEKEILPNFDEVNFDKIPSFLKEHNIHTVGELRQKLSKMDPTDVDVFYQLATSLRHNQQNWWGLAEEILKTLANSQNIPDEKKAFSYLGLAKIADRRNETKNVMQHLKSALEMEGNFPKVLLWGGTTYSILGQKKKGADLLSRALNHDNITKKDKIKVIIGLGNARFTDNDHEHDFDWYLEALAILGKEGDVNLRAQALIGLGNARSTDNAHKRADCYQEALAILGKEGDVNLRAQALIGLGNARFTNPAHKRADWYQEALKILGDNGDVNLRAQALIGLGNARFTDNDHTSDTDWYQEALKILWKNGDVNLRAQALIGLGNARFTDKDHTSDTDWYQEALAMLGDNGDVNLRAQALIGLGNKRFTDNDHTSNTDWYQEALKTLGNNGDVNLRAQALIGLGNARFTDNDHKHDFDWYQKALTILGDNGDVNLRAQALIGLGNARFTDNHHTSNTDWYQEALKILGKEGDVNLRAQALIGLGNARFTDNDHKHDFDWYQKALTILGDNGDVNLRAQALMGLGNASRSMKKNEEAITYYKDAQKLVGANSSLYNKASDGIKNASMFLNYNNNKKQNLRGK
ncbi:Tetratricopeptide repeat protein [Candidatus Bealeia paramacronuclearis]|uniref:Tetratricopeptide repeat protein n=2 Tax=Candidatus Bealeia paramacronuclearis TaxID=1921001 RepID=A0ABZ2C5S0_9PROT